MQIDTGEIRFLTKVAEKSPRGLKLVLFKEKTTGNEKLIFIVKTASQEIDKLALSRMTWQIEQSKAALRVVIVRMLILPEGSKEFFKSETGLVMNDDKDRRTLQCLISQKSVNIFFFNFENEFHSKIELLTTYNMHVSAQSIMNANPVIDESKMIVKSENLSENDVKKVMSDKSKIESLKEKDLIESIQKKMPTVSSSSSKTKLEENTKISVKSNDLSDTENYKNTISHNISKKTDINASDLKKSPSFPSGKITAEDLMRSIPPDKMNLSDILSSTKNQPFMGDLNLVKAEDLLKVVDSMPPNKITAEDLMKSIPPIKIKEDSKYTNDIDSVNLEELLKLSNSIPPGKITPDQLLRSIPPSVIKKPSEESNILTTEELLSSLTSTISNDNKVKVEDLLRSTNSGGSNLLDQHNLADIIRNSDTQGFFDQAKTNKVSNLTQEMSKDDLLSSLMSQESPLKLSAEEEKSLLTDLMSEPTPLKSSDGQSDLAKDMDVNIRNITPNSGSTQKKEENISISADDLLKALNGDA